MDAVASFLGLLHRSGILRYGVGAGHGEVARLATAMLGLMFFLFVFALHLPRVVAASHNGNEWTSMFVATAMCGTAWILAGSLGKNAYTRR